MPHPPKTLLLAALLAGALAPSPSQAITRRTDVADSAYISYALNDFGYTGKITGPWLGSGTLISSNWVVTAKHVVNSTSTFTFTTADGTSRKIVQTVMHPTLDLALVRLESDITNVTPVKLFSYDFGNDYGVECVIAGAGMSGTGITGQINGTQGPCRAGQEYAMYHGDTWGWNSNLIMTKFRSPDKGAQAMEGGAAQGDSGGGLFIKVNGEYCLAGEMSLVWKNYDLYGVYNNSGGAYINTTPYNDWILSYATNALIIPEPQTLGLLGALLTAFLIVRRRRLSQI